MLPNINIKLIILYGWVAQFKIMIFFKNWISFIVIRAKIDLLGKENQTKQCWKQSIRQPWYKISFLWINNKYQWWIKAFKYKMSSCIKNFNQQTHLNFRSKGWLEVLFDNHIILRHPTRGLSLFWHHYDPAILFEQF